MELGGPGGSELRPGGGADGAGSTPCASRHTCQFSRPVGLDHRAAWRVDMGQERTDEELLAAYQQGDTGAFELLLRRHRAPLFTFLVRMLGDRQRAEDLAQETFLRIVKGAQAWEHRARFQTWLFTIARNLCVDQGPRDPFRRPDSLDETGPDD